MKLREPLAPGPQIGPAMKASFIELSLRCAHSGHESNSVIRWREIFSDDTLIPAFDRITFSMLGGRASVACDTKKIPWLRVLRMSDLIKWSDTVHWLSRHRGEQARFHCPGCGISKTYDVDWMLTELGDIAVPSLPDVVAKEVGCKRFSSTGWDRCRMAPAYPAFRTKAKPKPHVIIPRGYTPLEHTTLGKINEWQIVYCKCRCGHLQWVDVPQLARRLGADTSTSDLAKRMRCKRCENRERNVFIFRNEKR